MKALIRDWNTSILGPNPFLQIGSFSSSFQLQFDPEVLKKCPSSQLATVGKLCNTGKAGLHALGGTILFTVDPNYKVQDKFNLEILSIVTEVDGHPVFTDKPCSISVKGESLRGAAGHVLLSYPTGNGNRAGRILVSSGHWIELAHLDVTLEGIIKHAEQQYGAVYAANLSDQIKNAPAPMQMQQMQCYAQQAVWQASPSAYGNTKKS